MSPAVTLRAFVPGRVPVRHMLMRRGELGVAAYLLATGASLLFFFDLNPESVGHAWMLRLFSEETWAGLFILFGAVALFGASLVAGGLRSACTALTLLWLLFLLISSLAHHALPLASCAQVGFVAVMGLTFFGDGTP